MKKALPLFGAVAAIIVFSAFLFFRGMPFDRLEEIAGIKLPGEENDPDAVRADNPYGRWLYEYNLMKDPATGRVPAVLLSRQKIIAQGIPSRDAFARGGAPNTYLPAGPDNTGGRTRCVAYDTRYNGTSNQVLIAGAVSGGIFKSTDGGRSWQWKATLMINSVTTIAQDTRPGRQDTWYCGTGEFVPTSYITGPSAADLAFIAGWGMFVSKDNGETWQPLSFTNTQAVGGNNPYQLDNAYDIINRVAVNPSNGDLYISRYGSIIRARETPAGSGTYVRESSLTTAYGLSGLNTSNQISDIVCSSDGRNIYAAFHGEDTLKAAANPVFDSNGNIRSGITGNDLEGIWKGSVDPATGTITWTKIAGGDLSAPAGWPAGRSYGRIVLGLSSGNDSLYALLDNHQNGQNNAPGGPRPEADLFRYDVSVATWTNLSSNVPARDASGRGAFQVQSGYDMALAVSPSNSNTIFIGGTNAFRSTDGFATANNTILINGYGRSGKDAFAYGDVNGDAHMGHPDIHWFAFRPGSGSEMICTNDGGMQQTANAGQPDSVYWNTLNNNYQTLQYYYVAVDPNSAQLTFGGGSQDNHCTLRNPFKSDPNAHDIFEVGDGCAVGISKPNANGIKSFYISSENGPVYRVNLDTADNYTGSFSAIKPVNAQGDFITYFLLDPDNTEYLYFASNDSLYKTRNASTVSSATWTLLKGVTALHAGSIRSLATTRGAYNTGHNLFIGTDRGRIFRLKDPANADSASVPQEITPSGMSGVVIGLAANPRNDDTLMAVVSNFNVPGIWWTGNANSATPSWQSCDGNLDSLSIRSCAIAVEQGGVEYYAGSSAGLFSTTAISGQNTVWLREGTGPLGYAVVSSLALRWSDNTLVIGTHGNGMFYTTIGAAVPVDTTPVPPPAKQVFIQNLYPTLITGSLQIQTGNLAGVSKMYVTVYNMAGQRMLSKLTDYQQTTLDLSYLPAGMYIIHITSDNHSASFTRKFIRQ